MELKSTENLQDVEHFVASFVRGAFEKYKKPGSEMLKAIVEETAGLLSAPSKLISFLTKPVADAGKKFYNYWDAKKTNQFQQKVKTIIGCESNDTFYDQFKTTMAPLAVHVYYVYERQLQTNIYLDTTAAGDQAQAVEFLASYAGNKCLEYMVEKESLDSAVEVLTMKSKRLEATSFCRLENYAKGNFLYFYEDKETKKKIEISSYKFFRKAIPVFVVNKEIIHWDSLRIHKNTKKPMGARLRRPFKFENLPKDKSLLKELPEIVTTEELSPNYFYVKTDNDQVVTAIMPKIIRKVNLDTTDGQRTIIAGVHEANKNICLVDTKVNEIHDEFRKLKVTSTKEEAPIIVRSFAEFNEPTDFLTKPRNIVHKIHERLQHCSTESVYLRRIVVLHGMAGIGKSELARMYAHTYRKDEIIQNVAWINAGSESSLKTSFELLAKKLKVEKDPSDIQTTVQNIYEHFSKNIGTGLFIFDNAPQMMKTENIFGIYDFLPTEYYEQRPLVLITARKNLWQRIPEENKIEVEVLRYDEEIEFIQNGLELTDKQKVDENVNSAIRSLAENLGGYTLALVLATSNIRNKMWGKDIVSSIEKYLERMNNLKGGWPQDRHSDDAPTNYTLIMSNVWSATFAQIASLGNEGQNALELLNYAAFLPTDGITLKKLSHIFDFSHHQSCDEQCFVLLEKYSLIKIISDTDSDCDRVRIHRLVQHCARYKLDYKKDFTSLFQICNYLTAQKGVDFGLLGTIACMHEHLTQRDWPEDSIKYPIIFSSLAIWNVREFYSDEKKYILAAKSFLDLQNQNFSLSQNVFDLFRLCLAFYITHNNIRLEVFINPSLKNELKEVILLYEKDYVPYLVEGSSDNVLCEDKKHSDFLTELCYRVCHRILTENVYLVNKEFGIEFQIFENLVAHFNSSDQRPEEVEAVNKVCDLLWTQSKSACPVSVVQVIKCAVKKHRQLQPTLQSATNLEKQMYWSNGGPFSYYIIRWRMRDADWRRAFLDAFFDEGGPKIIGQHLTYLSTSDDFNGLHFAFNHLTGLISDLGRQCSSKLIRDADFMESFLVFTKHIFSLREEVYVYFKAMCLSTWFALFKNNETVADSRGRSWSINDVTHEISLLLQIDDCKDTFLCWFKWTVSIFENFLEATKDEPESAAMKLAKLIVECVEEQYKTG